ncbi:snRNA-activating protein complex subunit 1 [Mytilus galloprovincialis]|uniref:snRNA-activating protein complex subunit 1 n=1 Tax=Mytilus galloprovincialis TaxID=29158 RepID=A0A8B6ET80_MYTGA|nr:snRNA-activating protein complex subunit 1 [Mytilus galloprovincialis]
MGRRRLLSQYQPTAGVNADFEKLLQQFTATETVRFEKFSEIWRELKMSFIFAGRDSERECREYTEEMMRWALKYLLPPYNFQVRVGGLYLLYGLFNQQPLVRKVRIRVTPEKWKEIIEFQTEARRQQHLDVNYVFQRLRFDDAFCYTATDTEVTFNLSTGTTIREEDTAPEEFKDEQSVLYDLFSEQFLEQLTQLHDHYHNVKVGLEGPDANEPSRSLNVIQTNIVPSLLGTVMSYQQRKQHLRKATDIENEDMHDEDNKPSLNRKTIKSEIKAKAYRNVAQASRSRRHRQAVDSADDSPEKQPKRGKRRKNKSESEATSPKRKKGRKKNIKKEEVDEEQMEGVQSPTKSEKSIGDDNLHTRDQEIDKSNQEEVGEREISHGDVLLHMPSFDTEPSTSGTQKSLPKKKLESPNVKKKVQKKKGGKGRMPSVKLQPLEKKTPKKKKIKKETITEEKT